MVNFFLNPKKLNRKLTNVAIRSTKDSITLTVEGITCAGVEAVYRNRHVFLPWDSLEGCTITYSKDSWPYRGYLTISKDEILNQYYSDYDFDMMMQSTPLKADGSINRLHRDNLAIFMECYS